MKIFWSTADSTCAQSELLCLSAHFEVFGPFPYPRPLPPRCKHCFSQRLICKDISYIRQLLPNKQDSQLSEWRCSDPSGTHKKFTKRNSTAGASTGSGGHPWCNLNLNLSCNNCCTEADRLIIHEQWFKNIQSQSKCTDLQYRSTSHVDSTASAKQSLDHDNSLQI